MSTSKKKAGAEAQTEVKDKAEKPLLDQILEKTPKVVKQDRVKTLLRELCNWANEGTVQYDKSFSNSIREAKRLIDQQLSRQLAEIMHHEKFQKLEGSWRGLKYLVMQSETCSTLKLKVLSVTKKELTEDLEKAVEFDQSFAFKHIYTSEFGMAGGEPFGALLGDYQIENNAQDLGMLEQMAQVAASGFCPFVTNPSPGLLGMDSFTELNDVRALESCFRGPDYIKWHALRDHPDSRFITMVMPRVMSRLPYGSKSSPSAASSTPIDEFDYDELVLLDDKGNAVEPLHEHYAWMNASWALGARLTDAFAKTNWCTAIRGFDNGGKVEGLPAHVFTSEEGDREVKCPTEVLIPDRRDAELAKQGLLGLVNWKNKDFSVFINGDTLHKPPKWTDADKNANERISARMPYLMATGRIAHFFKAMGRELLGRFMEREDVETYMKRWIAQYILDDPKPSEDMKAKYPLAAAQIEVAEDPENPGAYDIVARLRPWLQVEELNASLRLVARIPKQG